MEFQKRKRDGELFLVDEWRLACVEEVSRNMETIRSEGILNWCDSARLLDGWVDGPGYRYRIGTDFRPGLAHMLLVKTPVIRNLDDPFAEDMYSGVALSEEGRKAALFFSYEDKLTEVMCFVLKSMSDSYTTADERQSIADSYKAVDECQKELDRLKESLEETFSHRRTVLHYAADQSHKAKHAEYIVNLLLKKFYGKGLIKASDKNGKTALHIAALRGNFELCNILMEGECGLKPDEEDRNGENLLHFAVNSNKEDILEKLWRLREVRSLVGSQDAKGRTPLHKAAANGNTEIIKILFDGMNEERLKEYICQADLLGQTALHEAARGGHREATECLLQMGSRPLFERNSDGKTALHYSVQLADPVAKEMATILLRHCRSDEERLLLLWASATGMGTAEQSAKSSSEVQTYLKEQKERTAGSSTNLLVSAITFGCETLAWELVKRDANAHHMTNISCSLSNEQQSVNKFLQRVEKMPEDGRDQPTLNDSLGRKAIAEGLAALLLNPYAKSPVTVGISGDWGIGKSSLMLQTEMNLLQTGAQLAFPNILPLEDFPGSTQFELTQKGREKYNKVKNAVKDLLPATETDNIADPLVYFLDNYQDQYPQVYQSLALMDRSEMFRLKDRTSDSSSNLDKIPTILTVRYNAWHYQNESEAWSGLAVKIMKAMEETMIRSQRIRSRWRYAWKEQGDKIYFEFLFPCLLALFLSGWITWAVWMLLSRSKNNELHHLKYGAIPVTLVVVFWTVLRQLHSVFQPVSVQIMGNVRLRDHSTNLGYQHQVICDINFLKKQIREKSSRLWKFIAFEWVEKMCETVEGTSIPKSPPPSKDDVRIVVFVDDLDRCEDTVILQVLSAINLVLAVCEINVILGMDKKMIARAIAHKYKDNNNLNTVDLADLADKYLCKIVQLPLALPDSGHDETMKFLEQQLGEGFQERSDNDTNSNDPVQAHTLGDSQSGVQTNGTGNPPQSGPERPTQPLLDLETGRTENPPQIVRECWSIISQVCEPFTALWNSLCRCSDSGSNKTTSRLQSTPINSQLILPKYSIQERKAINFLSKQVMDGPHLPREWKKFLTYYRLAWNILFQIGQVKNLSGWQVQLLVWIFCCWQWKDNIDLIIKNWKKLVLDGTSVNDEDPSLKSIVDLYVEGISLDEFTDKWRLLVETLIKYDVPMESIQSFQKFRLNCEIGHLPMPPVNKPQPMATTSTSTSESVQEGSDS